MPKTSTEESSGLIECWQKANNTKALAKAWLFTNIDRLAQQKTPYVIYKQIDWLSINEGGVS